MTNSRIRPLLPHIWLHVTYLPSTSLHDPRAASWSPACFMPRACCDERAQSCFPRQIPSCSQKGPKVAAPPGHLHDKGGSGSKAAASVENLPQLENTCNEYKSADMAYLTG